MTERGGEGGERITCESLFFLFFLLLGHAWLKVEERGEKRWEETE